MSHQQRPTLHHAAAQFAYLIETTSLADWSIDADLFMTIACHALLLTREQAMSWWSQLVHLGFPASGHFDLGQDHLGQALIRAAERAEPQPLLAYQLALTILAAADDGIDRVACPE